MDLLCVSPLGSAAPFSAEPSPWRSPRMSQDAFPKPDETDKDLSEVSCLSPKRTAEARKEQHHELILQNFS